MFRPPFFARLLLRLLLNRNDRRTVMNDLGELYARRAVRDGKRAAKAWYRLQLAHYPFQLFVERFRRTARPAPRHSDGRESRESRPGEAMHNFLRDMRHSVRSLARTPVLTATIVLTVGLGIGATTAIFSVINAVLLRPLPYPDSDRLVWIYTSSPPNEWSFSVADYRALDEQQTFFSQVAGYAQTTLTLNQGDVADRVRGKEVTWTYFPLMGITPLHGRLFNETDGAPGTEPQIVVSHRFWTQYLDGDLAVLGQTVRLDGTDYTVVGVLPQEVGPFEHDRDFYIAQQWGPPPRKGPFFIVVLGRLAPGVDAAAREELRAINRRLFPVWQDSYQDQRATWGMKSLKETAVGDVGAALIIVLGAVGFVLLIACTNAANLLVARATHRSRELAVRAALGASRGRLLQHLLSESAILALGGAALGLVLTVVGIRLLTTIGADFIPRSQEIGLDGATVWFLIAITLASGLLFGVIPSLQGAKSRFQVALRSESRSATEGVGSRRLQRLMIVSQFAVAAPLLIGAGLLIGSLAKLGEVDPGFDTHNLLSLSVTLPAADYPEDDDIVAFWNEALPRIGAIPGVQGVAAPDGRPPGFVSMVNNFDLLDQPTRPTESQPATPWVAVTPGYFDLLRIPLLEGRVIDERDRSDGSPVAVVDEAWARRFYPNESALGRQFYSGGSTTDPLTVVGVVGNVKQMGLGDPDEGIVYWPQAFNNTRSRFVILRTAADPLSVLPSVRSVFRELDPTLPLSRVATIEEGFIDSLNSPRYLTVLVCAFAAVALFLSIIGIYGVLSYFVQQHTKDIGIRLALGGGPSNVLRWIVGQGMRLVGLGVAVGIGAAFALTRYMSSLLFGVGATDTGTFVSVSAVMLGVALLACFLPARRASRVDPMGALRYE